MVLIAATFILATICSHLCSEEWSSAITRYERASGEYSCYSLFLMSAAISLQQLGALLCDSEFQDQIVKAFKNYYAAHVTHMM